MLVFAGENKLTRNPKDVRLGPEKYHSFILFLILFSFAVTTDTKRDISRYFREKIEVAGEI